MNDDNDHDEDCHALMIYDDYKSQNIYYIFT